MVTRILFFFFVIFNVDVFAGIEYVETKRMYTPEAPFIPSMMVFAVNYMNTNNLSDLNRFEFYSSYVKNTELFTLKSGELERYKSKETSCVINVKDRHNLKQFHNCGRHLAKLYLLKHNLTPYDFGYESFEGESVINSMQGVYFLLIDDKRVLLDIPSGKTVEDGKLYNVKVFLSPLGDYDQREIEMEFDHKGYVYGLN